MCKKYNCYLINENQEKYWCVCHNDDSEIKLVFNKNPILENVEVFDDIEVKKILNHLNQYGYDLENQENQLNINVTKFCHINSLHNIFILDTEENKSINLKN